LGKFDDDMEKAIAQRLAELQPPKTKVRKSRSTAHEIGSEVRGPSGNPVWSRNELILALDLHLKLRGESIGKDNADVAELSAFLRKLGKAQGREGIGTFRNENGVRMKLMNFGDLIRCSRPKERRDYPAIVWKKRFGTSVRMTRGS
jgi:hypothetical protein